MEKAKENLEDAEQVLDRDRFTLSVNRSYYAMFTAARSLLALKELDSSKHSGVIALFNQHIIKAGLFPKELSKFLPKARDIRENADYGDFVEITREDAQTQLENARKFIVEAEKTMEKMIRETKARL
jgi:hypothetical protein